MREGWRPPRKGKKRRLACARRQVVLKGDAKAFGFKALLVIDSYRGSTFSATGWYSAFEEAMPKGRRIVQGALVEAGLEGGDVSEGLSF